MKTKWIFILSSALFLASCQNISFSQPDVKITLLENDAFTCEKSTYSVRSNEDLSIPLTIKENYAFSDCDYNGDYSVDQYTGAMNLTLKKVRYNTRLDIHTILSSQALIYHANGGKRIDGSEKDTEMQFVSFGHHLRPNTSHGVDLFSKEKATLTSWNTKADGTGDSVSLGSRITLKDNEFLDLYAVWENWTEESYFQYTENTSKDSTKEISLKKYIGPTTISSLVIPSQINNINVTSIENNFAQNIKIESLILPPSFRNLGKNAFVNCTIQQLIFSDDITEIHENCFSNTIPHIQINAVMLPRYMNSSDNSYFSEDYDRLVINQNKKKMIFFGGCSLSYGLDSPYIEQELNEEYVICNMGVIGGTNAECQIRAILPLMNPNDVFIHAPEEMSPYQLLYTLDAESRMFFLAEANYDILNQQDVSDYHGYLDAFYQYNDVRKNSEGTSYDVWNDHYNEYGDYIVERENESPDVNHEIELRFGTSYLTDEALSRLNQHYEEMQNKQVNTYFTFAPINQNCLTQEDYQNQAASQFSYRLKNNLNVTFISNINTYIMEGKYFYDTDYHLTTAGARKRSELLLSDLKPKLPESLSNYIAS